MLAIEMHKVKNRSSPEIMNEILQLRENNHYNLCKVSQFTIRHVSSVFNGSESVSHI